ncbi:MAG: membrane protein [Verrucomicrobia bacterium]|nr:MAG: membrane protein [Verrucomicrobiota bacterium]
MQPLVNGFTQLASTIQSERSALYLSRWIFIRVLGVIYLIAFISLWTQIDGLIGHNGILPVADYLEAVSERLGPERCWWVPTFCWFNASDGFIHLQCAAGVALSLLLIAGVAPVLDLLFLWAIYLSLSTVCRDFLSFQWDILLLETGFVAISLAPQQWLPKLSRETVPSVIVLWLCRWLLFRLMFMSGAVKLLSRDPTWWNLTALAVHYETQPLPTWIGWYAHQLPLWIQRTCCALMFITELAAPFLIFCGRRARQIACGAFVLFMLLISLTGNYCFFNLLTVALCLLLLDDAFWLRLLPSSAAAFVNRRLTPPVASGSQPQEASRPEDVPRPVQSRSQTMNLTPAPPEEGRRPPDVPVEFPLWDGSGVGSRKGLRTIGVAVLAAIVLVLSGLETVARLFRVENLPRPALQLLRLASPLRTVNSYGLFAVMTTTRPEIVVEGSNDGVIWLPYEFKWKPGELKRRPAFVAPHQPRLDWQMWFAALGDYRREPWFMNFLVRLLQGSPEVLALLQKNPFPDPPPRSVRAVLYEYRFTDVATRRATGEWWRRECKGLYCPEISLRQN